MKKIKRKKKVPATTNNVTNAIIRFLLSEKHSASRINTQGQYDEIKEQYRPSGSRKGYADISACIMTTYRLGRGVCIEVKNDGDRQSPDQKAFEQEWTEAGGIYLEINRPVEFYEWYFSKPWIIKRSNLEQWT